MPSSHFDYQSCELVYTHVVTKLHPDWLQLSSFKYKECVVLCIVNFLLLPGSLFGLIWILSKLDIVSVNLMNRVL